MAAELTQDLTPQAEVADIPTPPTDLPYDDGEPLESNRHRIAMNVLIDSLHTAFAEREDYFVGGNMFLYYSQDQAINRDFRGPDFFAVLRVDGRKERKYWAIWEESGRYPDVIIELMSASTRTIDLVDKKELYANTFRTFEYFVYDPFAADSLQGWCLGGQGAYQAQTPDERGWLWCETLGVWLGVWQGELLRETAPWLRFYDPAGSLILLPVEQAARERQRAEQAEAAWQTEHQARLEAIARLLALGLSPAEAAGALAVPLDQVEQMRARPTP